MSEGRHMPAVFARVTALARLAATARVAAAARVVAAAFPLVATACTSAGPLPANTLANVYLEEIEQLLEEGQSLDAVQRISALARDPEAPMGVGSLATLREQAISSIGSALTVAVAEQRFLDAVALRRSLHTIEAADEGASPLPSSASYSVPSLYRQEVERLATGGDTVPALMLGLRLAEAAPDLLTSADYGRLLQLATDLGNRRAAELIAEALPQTARPSDAVDGETVDYAQMLRGMVTVLVDRGITIRRGVGVPDRVIGSGFFIDPRGYILTNHHVIQSEVDPEYEGYSRLSVLLSASDDERVPAKVIGYDRIFDLALLKAEIDPGFVFTSAARTDLTPGDRITAIGSPGGLSKTITSGIVSATGRRFLQLGDAIQVDAPLNPGNSGGPLLNDRQELVGVTFAGLEQFEGINFGIPFDWIQDILPRLYRGGEVAHQWLGLSAVHHGGATRVTYVVPGSPAAHAGLLPGDELIAIDGAPAGKVVTLQRQLIGYDEPTLVSVRVRRDGEPLPLVVSLQARPYLPILEALERDTHQAVLVPLFGLGLELISETLFQTEYRVERVVPGSIADETGISVGDPVRIEAFRVEEGLGAAFVRLFLKKRRAGFLENVVLLAAPLEVDSFL